MLRSLAFAFAAVIASLAAPAFADETPNAQCDAMSVRVYFQHGSATLTPAAMQAVDMAARMMAGCEHSEMNVMVGGGQLATARGQAIMTAMREHGFDAMRVEPMPMMQTASMSSPEFAEVTMTP